MAERDRRVHCRYVLRVFCRSTCPVTFDLAMNATAVAMSNSGRDIYSTMVTLQRMVVTLQRQMWTDISIDSTGY